MNTKLLLHMWAFLCLPVNGFAQISKGITCQSETSISLSSGSHTPLWLTANKQGLGSIRKNNAYLMAGIFRPMEENKPFTYGLGVELVGTSRYESKFFIRQAYLDLKWHFLGATIGSKNRYSEFKNQELSSGGLTFSGNSLPIPQVKVGIPEYVAIPGTKNWLSVRGYIAYGIFTDGNWQEDFTGGMQRYTKKMLFHDKAIFFKVGNANKFPLTLDFGLEMPARFSGEVHDFNSKGEKVVVNYPYRLKDFWNVLLPTNGDGKTSGADQTNILGDMLGSWHFSLNYKADDWNLRAYMEHHFNDHSQLFWEYGWKDGLWGLEATLPKNKLVSSVVYEYLYSKDQTGPIYHDTNQLVPDQISGADDYYNHDYYAGWQHWGMAIGNPLFVSPVYNEDGCLYFRSNRLKGHHIGISGNPSEEWKYRVLFSYVQHWGTYNNPFAEVKYNANGLAEVSYSPKQWKHWMFTGAVAADKSDFIGNSWGGMITVRFTK